MLNERGQWRCGPAWELRRGGDDGVCLARGSEQLYLGRQGVVAFPLRCLRKSKGRQHGIASDSDSGGKRELTMGVSRSSS